METKKCTKCNIVKTIDQFGKEKNGKYGVQSRCKVCRAEIRKEQYEKNKVTEIEYGKQYRKDNQEKEKARAIISEVIKKYQENLTFYNSWKPSEQNFGAMDIVTDIEQYRSLLQAAKNANDLEFYNKEKVKFNNFNKMFQRFGRDME